MYRQRFNRFSQSLAVITCYIGPAVMVTADIVTIVLNPNVSPVKQSISGFAIGPYGWLEKIGIVMVALSFGLISINLLIIKNKKELRLFKFVGVLFMIVAIGFLMISIFNTNVFGTIINFQGLVHQLASVAVSIVFYVSCLITMYLLINKPGFRYFGMYSGLTFLVGFAVLLWLGFAYHHNEYMGLTERIIAGFNLMWIILVGPQLTKLVRTL